MQNVCAAWLAATTALIGEQPAGAEVGTAARIGEPSGYIQLSLHVPAKPVGVPAVPPLCAVTIGTSECPTSDP
jgi:hypothetical protein